jgi:serine/threonine protein phosphatase PrpC
VSVLVRAAAVSDTGPFRKTNEDAFLCADDLGLFVVADGMGGHHAGEIASRLAVEAIAGFIQRSTGGDEFSWPCGIDPTLSLDGNRLRTAIYLANRRVFRAAEAHDDYTGMGTTVVSALITDGKAIVGHVGDSRLYVCAAGEFRKVTADDSWAATIVAQNPGDNAALARHPLRHVLTSVLGARDHTEIHMTELTLAGDEIFLLCSDGLHSALPDAEIARVLAEDREPAHAARRLVDAALANGTRDNVTVLLVRCEKR